MITNQNEKTFILSLGGSLIVPSPGIDVIFLSAFEKFIRQKVKENFRFFIVCGGGTPARQYRDAAVSVCGKEIDNEDLDWLGVHTTRLNAHLLRTIFRDIAYDKIIKHYDIIDKKAIHPVVIGSGWKPGWSTDYDAVLLAQDYRIGRLINLSNIDMVYTQNPYKYKNAKPIRRMTWNELMKLTGKYFSPGLSSPFDPIASQLAKSIGLRVIITNGKNIKNLDNILKGKKFVGTVIE